MVSETVGTIFGISSDGELEQSKPCSLLTLLFIGGPIFISARDMRTTSKRSNSDTTNLISGQNTDIAVIHASY